MPSNRFILDSYFQVSESILGCTELLFSVRSLPPILTSLQNEVDGGVVGFDDESKLPNPGYSFPYFHGFFVKPLSRVWLFATPWTAAYQAQGLNLGLPHCQADVLPSEPPGKSHLNSLGHILFWKEVLFSNASVSCVFTVLVDFFLLV